MKEYSSLSGWPCFPDTPADNDESSIILISLLYAILLMLIVDLDI
jgi:hypothetical protein